MAQFSYILWLQDDSPIAPNHIFVDGVEVNHLTNDYKSYDSFLTKRILLNKSFTINTFTHNQLRGYCSPLRGLLIESTYNEQANDKHNRDKSLVFWTKYEMRNEFLQNIESVSLPLGYTVRAEDSNFILKKIKEIENLQKKKKYLFIFICIILIISLFYFFV